MEAKKCSKCGEIKAVGEFNKSKKEKSGLTSQCKKCKSNHHYIKKYGYIKIKEVKEIVPEGFKKCSKCKIVKNVNEFHRDKGNKDGLHGHCKKCCGKKDKIILPEGFKKCSKCKEIKKIDEFGKRSSWCKKCGLDNYYIKRYGFIPKKEIVPEGFKKCNICKEIKSLNEFNNNSKIKNGKDGQCKKCRSIYYQNNKTKLKVDKIKKGEYNKKWQEKNKHKRALYAREYRENNVVRIKGFILNIKYISEDAKPALEGLIILRKKNKIIKELKNG